MTELVCTFGFAGSTPFILVFNWRRRRERKDQRQSKKGDSHSMEDITIAKDITVDNSLDNNIDIPKDINEYIADYHNIIVVVGAGLS